MADQVITKQALIDAQKDAQALEEVINGEPGKLVKTRLNRMVYTLASVPQINTMTREEVSATVAPKADKVYVDNIVSAAANGVIPFQTQSELLLAKPTQVKVLAKAMDVRKEYLWNRTSAEGVTPVTGTWTDTGLSELDQAKEYADKKGLIGIWSFGTQVLTQIGLIGGGNNYYNSSDFIAIDPDQILRITTQLYGIDYTCTFYDLRKQLITTDDKAASNYNGIIKKYINVPRNARFIKVMSVNSTRPGYLPYTFLLEVLRKDSYSDSHEVTIDYEKLDKEGLNGSSVSAASLYKHLILPVVAGQTITYKEIRASGVPPIIIYDADYNILQSHVESSKTITLPAASKYVLLQTYAKTHASYSAEWASKTYFKRGYADQLENIETRLTVKQLSNEVEILKRGNTLSFTEVNFTEAGTAETYNRTPKIETFGLRKLYIRGLVSNGNTDPAGVSIVRGYSSSGNSRDLIKSATIGVNRLNNVYDIPEDIIAIDVYFMNETHPSYNPNYGRYVVIGRSEEDIFDELNKIAVDTIRNDFQIKRTHAFSGSVTYDSVRIPVYPSMQLKYSVAATGGSGLIVYDDGTRENLYENAKTLRFDRFGYVTLSTYNSTHASYNPSFIPSYQILKTQGEDEIQNVKQFITGSYLPTPTLKAIREIVYSDGTHKTAIQYLWHDQDGNFFVSSTLRGDKKFIFKFESQNFYSSDPHHFSMGFDKYGNIVCVFRIEHLNLTTHSDSVRKNPIILMKDQGYKPIIVSLGSEALKPSGWLQNCGFLCTDEYIMLTEYTRPSVATANTWKATYPLTEAANWKTVQSFALSPEVNPPDNMKHIHNVDRDPFTGYIYTSTGDNNAGAAMFMSKDGGETFSTILSGSEKYCRVLNWVFTKDWIYWATDTPGSSHWFFKAPRNLLGEMDATKIVDILQFPMDSWATYATIYMPKINALVFLGRADNLSTSLPIDIYDLKNDRFIKLDTLKPVGNIASTFGFRCECFEWIPRGNEIACGFSRDLGPGGYENKIGILGNTTDVTKKVNNLILTIDRFGDDFTISYDTVVL